MKYILDYKNQKIIVDSVEPWFPEKYRESPEKYRGSYVAKDKDGNMVFTYSRPIPAPESVMEVLVGDTERANIRWLVNTMPKVFDIYAPGGSYIQVYDGLCVVNNFGLFVFTPQLSTIPNIKDGAYYVVALEDNRVVLSPQDYSLDFSYDLLKNNPRSSISVTLSPKQFRAMCNHKNEFVSFIFGKDGVRKAATLSSKVLNKISSFPATVSATFTYKGMKAVISENGTPVSGVEQGFVVFSIATTGWISDRTALVAYTEFHRVAEKDLGKAQELEKDKSVLVLEE